MVLPAATANDMTLTITEEIRVRAPLEVTFAALLEELGPLHQVADDRPLPMKLEAWPGGRWYRDLGGDNGHLWGHVQAIKRPTLVEILRMMEEWRFVPQALLPGFSDLQSGRMLQVDGLFFRELSSQSHGQ